MGFDSFPHLFFIEYSIHLEWEKVHCVLNARCFDYSVANVVSSFMIMHLHLNAAFAIIPVEAKSELEIEPRYPLFGGWKATFVIGYGLPLQDFLFESSDDKRYLNFTFGCPLIGMVVDKLTIKVVLPEGSTDPSPVVPFPVEHRLEVVIPNITLSVSHNLVHLQRQFVLNINFCAYNDDDVNQYEGFALMHIVAGDLYSVLTEMHSNLIMQAKYSSLDVVGRTVVVLEKKNFVPMHNSHFQ
ncbi:hypothetical protein Gogos_003808, partial [Gossypium gossypioides]|nr:hypothetical protein [Gossypium gossypioides]